MYRLYLYYYCCYWSHNGYTTTVEYLNSSAIFLGVARTDMIRLRSMNSNVVLKVMWQNPVSNTRRVSGGLDLVQYNEVRHLHGIVKYILSYLMILDFTKILLKFWLVLLIVIVSYSLKTEGVQLSEELFNADIDAIYITSSYVQFSSVNISE